MKRECGKVGNGSHFFAVPFCTKGVCGVSADGHSAQGMLDVVGRLVDRAFVLHDLHEAVIFAWNTSQVHRNDGFGIRCDGCLEGIIIHFEAVGLYINKDEFGTHVAYDGGRSRVCVCRYDNFIAFANA